MIRLMSDCLLRISEAVAVNVEDITNVLTVRTSKTDQEGEGVTLYVGQPTLEAIKAYRIAGAFSQGICSGECAGISFCRLGRANMAKNVNYEHEVVLLIESKNSLRVAKPNAFRSSGGFKSVGFRIWLIRTQ